MKEEDWATEGGREGRSREGGLPRCRASIGPALLQTPVPPVPLPRATKLQRVSQFTGNSAVTAPPLIHPLLPLSLSFSLPPSSKLYAKLQCIKAEIQDVNDEHVRSRQELEQIQNELTRELKFK